jgi:hypothetical protein
MEDVIDKIYASLVGQMDTSGYANEARANHNPIYYTICIIMEAESDRDMNDAGVKIIARSRNIPKDLYMLLLLVSVQSLGLKIMYLPLNRLIENRICRDYYLNVEPSVVPSNGVVPEHLCKNDAIQQQLATLFGTIESIHLFIGKAQSNL